MIWCIFGNWMVNYPSSRVPVPAEKEEGSAREVPEWTDLNVAKMQSRSRVPPEWSKQNVLRRWQFSKSSNLLNSVVALVANLAMSFLETSYPQSGSLMLHFPPPPKSTEVSTQPLPTSLEYGIWQRLRHVTNSTYDNEFPFSVFEILCGNLQYGFINPKVIAMS